MTEEELIAQKYKQQQDSLNKQKALEDEQYKRQQEQAAATRLDNQTTLDKNKLISQGNIEYSGSKAQAQGKVLDNFTGFGDGAGIARYRARENATKTNLNALQTEYGQKSQEIQKNYDSSISDLNFFKSKADQQYADQTAEIANNLKLAQEDLRLQKAEEANKAYLAEQKSIENERQKLVANRANAVISYINKGNENGAYSPEQIDRILQNAINDKNNGFSQSDIDYIRSKFTNKESLGKNLYVTNTETPDTKSNYKNSLSELDKLESNRYKNSVGWIRRGAEPNFNNWKKTATDKVTGNFKLDNSKNFARDTENMANYILDKVDRGEITTSNAQSLFNKYGLSKDIALSHQNGYLNNDQLMSIVNRGMQFGLDL